MITEFRALSEFSPFIVGLLFGLLTPIRNGPKQRAFTITASLAIGAVFAFVAGELSSGSLTAVTSIFVDSGAAAVGQIVAISLAIGLRWVVGSSENLQLRRTDAKSA
jgi:hypothetical protein